MLPCADSAQRKAETSSESWPRGSRTAVAAQGAPADVLATASEKGRDQIHLGTGCCRNEPNTCTDTDTSETCATLNKVFLLTIYSQTYSLTVCWFGWDRQQTVTGSQPTVHVSPRKSYLEVRVWPLAKVMPDAADRHQPHKFQARTLVDDMLHSSRGVSRRKAMLTWQEVGRFVPSSARDLPSPQPGRSQQMRKFLLSLEKLFKSTNLKTTPFRLFHSSQQDKPA